MGPYVQKTNMSLDTSPVCVAESTFIIVAIKMCRSSHALNPHDKHHPLWLFIYVNISWTRAVDYINKLLEKVKHNYAKSVYLNTNNSIGNLSHKHVFPDKLG